MMIINNLQDEDFKLNLFNSGDFVFLCEILLEFDFDFRYVLIWFYFNDLDLEGVFFLSFLNKNV